jgi:probable HAF family extracellular repeat protein
MRLITLITCLWAAVALAGGQEDSANYTYSKISDPKGTDGTFTGRINNAGELVGHYLTASKSEAGFLYSTSKGTFVTIIPPGATNGGALDINNSGEIVGWYSVGSGPQIAFLYSNDKYIPVSSPSKTLTSIEFTGINDSGTIAGTIFSNTQFEGFTYSAGKFSNYIKVPDAVWTKVFGISDSGEIVGDYKDSSTGKTHGFSYAGGKFTDIYVPDSTATAAYGISYTTGQIVGAYSLGSGAITGFLFKNGAFTDTDIKYPESKYSFFDRFER